MVTDVDVLKAAQPFAAGMAYVTTYVPGMLLPGSTDPVAVFSESPTDAQEKVPPSDPVTRTDAMPSLLQYGEPT